MKHTVCVGLFCVLTFASQAGADDIRSSLEKLRSEVFSPKELPEELLESEISSRLKLANQRSTDAWRAIKSVEDWERLRDRSIELLRKSLGDLPVKRDKLAIHVAREIKEDGYVIRNITFESRPGLLVTANLYVPDPVPQSMPGILLSHSHHSPKSQGELQDMGALWARAGCLVLVPDHLGHGERRQHPFVSAADYPEKFQVGRQDYHFRYNTAIQLYLVGDSLMGWLAWDLMCGVDVLLAQPGIDAKRIALLGAVAGGGDPAAAAAALDPRITVLVPFNFGGPQPETRFPIPKNAEEQFDYAGGGSWESTRNLARSASDGFLPWIIVGSVAPRGLIHAHEFSWDREHDPVWKRYEQIYAFYDAQDQLSFTHGFGLLRQDQPAASHCNNIGKPHRQRIHEYFREQWGINVDEERPIVRHTSDELACLANITDSNLKNKPLYQLTSEIAAARNAGFMANRKSKGPDEWTQFLREAWTKALGNIGGNEVPTVESRGREQVDKLRVERWDISGGGGTRLPVMLLLPEPRPAKIPVVLAISQEGKDGFLKKRSAFLSELLKHSAVCLVDVRGTGGMTPGDGRGRRSAATSLAASELMLGDTLLAARLRDLRIVLSYLRMRGDLGQIALFGDSLANVNGPDVRAERPLDLDQPALAEPSGSTLALLAGLFENDSMIIAARGGLVDYRSILENQFIHVPFDAIAPGAATIGDLPELAKAVGSRNRLRMSGLVDGRNRLADSKVVQDRYGALASEAGADSEIAKWLIGELKGRRSK